MHLDEQQLLLYLEDRVQKEERALIEDHAAQCERCAHLLAGLSRLPQILEHPARFDPDEAVMRKAVALVKNRKSHGWFQVRMSGSPVRVALAGATVVVVALTAYLLGPREEPDRFRSETEEVVPELKLFPLDGAIVSEKSPVFRWTSIRESAAYRFSLLDNAGTVIWSNDVRDTSLSLPSFVVLQSGKTYLWSVETFFADKSFGRSALHAFSYSPTQ